MKKILLVLASLLLINTVVLCAEETAESAENSTQATQSENTISAAPAALSKGESFMAAFGMGDSGVIGGGESGGTSGSGASVAAAMSTAHVGSTVLTSPQNTPYSYK
ncbi:hypothetical protein H5J22_09375 [Cetobacterium sp. 8H]|uniref:hypothetical protein n=1 Tax=Cetobacterium sp. 8H TaxID=2759681 RepID=UPI00163C0D2D|nr:hypothetical protein [Cetobacterium sp. 8H]MBC2851600.1 hypothetical protein [Cetobacterium sp. 8H]